MTTIVTRVGKGSALTFQEGDDNFTNLNTDKIESVQQDSAPTLGGNLIVNNNQIRAEGSDNLIIVAGGTGFIALSTQISGNIVLSDNGSKLQDLFYNEKVHDLGTTSGTVTPNVGQNGNVQTITLNGNLTLNAFASPQPGQSVTLIIKQDATGSRTLTSTMKFAGGNNTLTTTASGVDIVSVFYDGTDYYASLATDFK